MLKIVLQHGISKKDFFIQDSKFQVDNTNIIAHEAGFD